MKRSLPAIIVVLIVTSMFMWALFAPKENISGKISKKLSEQKQKADLFMRGVTFSEIVGGVKYWEIKSISSEINKNKDTALLTETKGAFFKKGIATFHILSPKVFWNMRNKEIFIESALGYSRNFKFETKNLNWSLASKKLKTDDDVVIDMSGSIIKAKGLSADVALEKVDLKGRPHAEIQSGIKDGIINMDADVFEIDGIKNIIKASGFLKANQGELNIESGSAEFKDNEKILNIHDNVRISFRDIAAASDFASYNVRSRKIILIGGASAKRGGSNLNGDKLIIDLKDNKIGVMGRTKAFIEEEVITKEMNGK